MNNNLGVNLGVRLQIMNFALKEYAKAFGADEQSLNIIEKGVLNQKILEKILIHYKNSDNTTIAIITLSIDWEKHIIYANDTTKNKNLINVDSSIPILEQLDRATTVIINHTIKLRKEFNVTNVVCHFQYRDEIRNNEVERKKADNYLGLVYNDIKQDISYIFANKLNFVMALLEEVETTIEY